MDVLLRDRAGQVHALPEKQATLLAEDMRVLPAYSAEAARSAAGKIEARLVGAEDGPIDFDTNDKTGVVIEESSIQVWGVDGTFIPGLHDRYLVWSYRFDPANVALATEVGVVQSWHPDWSLAGQLVGKLFHKILGSILGSVLGVMAIPMPAGDTGGEDPNAALWHNDPWYEAAYALLLAGTPPQVHANARTPAELKKILEGLAPHRVARRPVGPRR
jgi:hypothetical protein